MGSQFSHLGHRSMKQTGKTYAEYLKESKPITNHAASVSALPGRSKGDSHRHRRKLEAMKLRG